MKQLLKQVIQKTPFYHLLNGWNVKRIQMKEYAEWKRNGKPVPPPHIVKQQTLQAYAEKFRLKILVETGTYYGDMVEAMKDKFDSIYSIELSKDLHEKSKKRFKGVGHIELINGDSGNELSKVISKIHQPALFWLDGHYSAGITACGDKETPIYEELDSILNATDRGHVIIIDDARCFGEDPAYPSIEELSDFIRSKRVNVDIVVRDDNIRITPKN